MGSHRAGWKKGGTLVQPVSPHRHLSAILCLDDGRGEWHCDRMAVPLATRLRALWLVFLLVLAPAGPAGLILSGHLAGADPHGETAVHDPTDHGIAAGELPVNTPDRHCPYCQTASSLRFGWVETPQYLRAPSSTSVDRIELQGGAPRSDSRAALPARAPPSRA